MQAERRQRPPLRIAMVVPPWVELPPAGYGGLEQVCAGLIDRLTARGHQVTLFGAGTKTGTSARFVSTIPETQYLRLGQTLPEVLHTARLEELLTEDTFDVVHDHTLPGLLVAPQRRVPTVATVHGNPIGDIGDYLSHVDRSVGLVSISYAQRRLGPKLPWAATVYNGYTPSEPSKTEPGTGPVLWLARFNPDKGPDLAIEACKQAGLPLVLAGKSNEPNEKQYLDEVISKMLHPGVELVMNPDRKRCFELLYQAQSLLLPIRWEEPFGMVLIEALATGTPVVALNHGAVPEVVRHGETGLICEDPSELPDALHAVTAMDPNACVEHVRTFFSADLMACRYEEVYRRWAAAGPPALAYHDLAPAVALTV